MASVEQELRARLEELSTNGAQDLYEALSAPEGRAKYLIKRSLRSAALYAETLTALKRIDAK